MDRRNRSLRENRYPSRRDREISPSFSSTLLDTIYRSIDEGAHGGLRASEDMLNRAGFEDDPEEMAKLRRACLIEKWMEKKVIRRGSMTDFEQKEGSHGYRDPLCLSHSSSTSSDSSSGSGFSSSEPEFGYKPPLTKPKMNVRASAMPQPEKFNHQIKFQKDLSKANHENGYVNSKSKAATKIYNDFKKSKQPLSPGGRLTSFLNSLFATSSTKKTKISTSSDQLKETPKSKQAQTSTCSSASSFSRSYLNRTNSSRENLTSSNLTGTRSVKFRPVNITLDEYHQTSEQKTPYDANNHTIPISKSIKHHNITNSINEELKLQNLVEITQDSSKNHKKQIYLEHEVDLKNEDNLISEEDAEDDTASYASSDLFELNSLSAIEMDDELPVYETTHYPLSGLHLEII